MHTYTSPFNQLTTNELFAALHLRALVFVVEQNCPYLDPDVHDTFALHVFMWKEQKLVAYARILPPGIHYDNVSIGRVVVHPDYRGIGLGKQIFGIALAETRKLFPTKTIQIMAQCYLLDFYAAFSFVPVGHEFIEDGIPHMQMMLQPDL